MSAAGDVDVGVLVVHGIGEQRREATLTELDDALAGSARRWLGADRVSVSRHPAAGSDPAYARVRVDDGAAAPVRALVAEGWWAAEVPTPGFTTLLRWLATVVPFVVPRVLDAGLRRSSIHMDDAPWWRPDLALFALWRVVQNVFVVGVTLALLVLLLAMWVLALPRALYDRIAGPAARRTAIVVGALAGALLVALVGDGAAEKLALAGPLVLAGVVSFTLPRLVNSVLASYIGDCYALLAQPKIERAMVARVEHSLAWLERAVPGVPIAIFAHSQGAEIVRRVLAERPGRIAGLLTFGSGIAKLRAVAIMRRRRWASMGVFALRIGAAALVVAAAASLLRSDGDVLRALVAIALAMALLTCARVALRGIVGKALESWYLGDKTRIGRWMDFYTSNDPVSEDELPIRDPWGYSREIVNIRVLLVDHVMYWRNVQAFCAPAILELAALAGRPRDERLWDAAGEAARVRARGVRLRVVLRWVWLLAASAVIAATDVRWFVLAPVALVLAVAVELVLLMRERKQGRAWSPCPAPAG